MECSVLRPEDHSEELRNSQCLDLGFEGIVLPSQKLDMSTVVGPKGPLGLLLFVADEAVVALGKVMVQAAKEILPFVEEAFGWATVGGLLEAKVFADVPVGVLVVKDVVPKGSAFVQLMSGMSTYHLSTK
jgi:hypothetical protein